MNCATSGEAMRCLMEARSVAVVGASERPDSSAGFVMRNLLTHGYTGTIYPVHPTARSVFGRRAAPCLAALEVAPDAVVVGIAAERVLDVIDEAGGLGIKAAVVLASGFAEVGEEGQARQAELAKLARSHAMALCGPNCLGIYVPRAGLALYSSRISPVRQGAVAIVSHSGAGAITLANTGRFGISHLVSAGNGAVTDIPDYLRYLAGLESVREVGLIIEQIREPRSFADAMAQVHAAGKTALALHVGRTAHGTAATAAHTGALATSSTVISACFRDAGIIEVQTMDEFIETAVLLSSKMTPTCADGGVAAIGVSGGGLAHLSDVADNVEIAMPPLTEETRDALRKLLPGYVTPRNPLDVTGVAFSEPGRYRSALEVIEQDPAISLIAAVQDVPMGLDEGGAEEHRGIAEAVAGFAVNASVPVVFLSNLSAGPHPRFRSILETAGVPMVFGTHAGLLAIKRYLSRPQPRSVEPLPLLDRQERWVTRLTQGAPLGEREAKAFLRDHGMQVARERPAATRAEAIEAAIDIGFPVAMKIDSPDLSHKTEIGGVRLNIRDQQEAGESFDSIMETVSHGAPQAMLRGVLVQQMIVDGTEALVGLARHDPFGLAVLVGVGGVLVEVIGESALGLPPIDSAGARALIGATKLDALLGGYRGRTVGDREALAETVVLLSRIAMCYGDLIEAADLNPVKVLARGEGVRVLDALIIPSARRY
jgi:acetate---CoA ligase (ADP-forming)